MGAEVVVAGADRRAGASPGAVSVLMRQWRQEVEGVEEGYSWCAPELMNDLGCRTTPAEEWPQLAAAVREAWEPELRGLDERFRAATIPWPGHGDGDGQWWMWRIPRLIYAEPGERCDERGWPAGWDMMPFAKPDAVRVIF
ncbi:hypothetical protein ACFYS8_15400 [Kitasatospora sp. NPDC004615]|uniref:hypothetical protein n=1 Tax=Kitasatospora sp. NPDC004615 TaxID=3364017 RepID=UPI0036A67930